MYLISWLTVVFLMNYGFTDASVFGTITSSDAADQPVFLDAKEIVTRSDIIDDSVDAENSIGEPIGPDDYLRAENMGDVDLIELGYSISREPLEQDSSKIEGDMIINGNIGEFILSSTGARNAVKHSWKKWPGGRIPYVLSASYGWYARSTIAKAMKRFHEETCIKFESKTDADYDYIRIYPDEGCYSLVGRAGGEQPLSLTQECLDVGTIMHELMHSTGFFHEQSRTDRDDWINIKWENVRADAVDQFEKYSSNSITLLGEEYDYGSIMHYSPYAFSENNLPTIRTTKPGGWRIGQREDFSSVDIRKLNKLYTCDSSSTVETDSDAVVDNFCVDVYSSSRCVIWRFLGYCSTKSDVQRLCQKTCDTCTEITTTTPKPTTTSTTPLPTIGSRIIPSICRDENTSCNKWADMGFCLLAGYQKFMQLTCAHSCGYCVKLDVTTVESVKKTPCTDTSNMCALAMWSGLCHPDQATEFIKANCRKTCDFDCQDSS